MPKIFLAFFLIFLAIYSTLHFYVLGRLFVWMNWPLDTGFYVLITLLTFSFFFASGLEQKFSHWFTNIIYMIAATWMGVMGILLVGTLLGEVAAFFFPAKQVVMGVVSFGLFFTIVGLVLARNPKLSKYERKGSVSIKIGVLTDIHLGPVHGKKYIHNIIERFKKENIDLLLLVGDIIDGPGELPADLLTPFNDLKKPTYISWGNHEHYLGKTVDELLKPTNIIPLRNKQVSVKGITLIGIDDAEDKQQVAKHITKFKTKGYTVLMYHRPDGLEDAAAAGVDLMVSGHTHNGQIFPFTLLVKTRFSRIKGWYKKGKTWLYVSTGAGTWGPPLRFGSHSEMVVINVAKKL